VEHDDGFLVIEEDRFAISWNGTETELGNTDAFRLCLELVTRRHRNVSHEDIRVVLDKPDMSPEALRQAICALKHKLPTDLRDRIVADVGYYRFE
jgi:hypothetical protein